MKTKKIVIGIILAMAFTFAVGAAHLVVSGPEPANACADPTLC